MSAGLPELSVILCTHNPRRDVLKLVLESLSKQTLGRERWEFIIVDNHSDPPLDGARINRGFDLPMRIVCEPELGLTPARMRGVSEARADVMVMVDDDNILDPDYLEAALEIARQHPKLGAFGGVTRPVLEGRVRPWQEKMLPYLGVRDYGQDEITSDADEWGKWEPIGAGMVVRREVVQKFVEFVHSIPGASDLARNGKALLSGEDSLMARSAYRLGYSCSYQPRLKLGHFIKRGRLRFGYLARLLYGHGRSYVILNNVLGKPTQCLSRTEVLSRLPFRCLKDGFPGAIIWAWDIGYMVESRAVHRNGVHT
ncbi:MAG: glycosyltransferase [Tepidisphaeraceae bacterium]|jgi:glycosyltransferase involved in cell wall biosynthesis